MEAVGKNRPDFVLYLTTGASTLGIDINQKDKEGNNVLFYTAAGGNLNLLKTLLAAGERIPIYGIEAKQKAVNACMFAFRHLSALK